MNEFSELKGRVLKNIEVSDSNNEIKFYCENGDVYLMHHDQDCCEHVEIESIVGDLEDLIGNEILLAEEVASQENPEGITVEYQDSFTWTFYKIATRKGYVDIRWYGESNGYYSESVDFELIKKGLINE